MFPYILRLSELSIPSYPILYGIGITLSGVVLLTLGKREGHEIRKLAHLILALTLAIIVGGRIFFVLQHLDDFKGNWSQAFNLYDSGQVFYGGLLLAIPSLILFCRMVHLPASRIIDLVAVAAPLGLAVGRLGCFCRGCCYGKISNMLWAVTFPKHVDVTGQIVGSPPYLDHMNGGFVVAGDMFSMPVHPSQIYSSCASLVVFFVMLLFWKTECAKGHLLFIYLIFYAISRFFLEFFRVNEIVFAELTLPQIMSIIAALLSSIVIAVSCGAKKRP